MQFDTLISNAIIVTVNPRFEVINSGVLGIKDGRIAHVGHGSPEGHEGKAASEVMIDAAGGILLPGLVNSHTHLPMTLFRGLADDLPLDRWLNEHIFPAEAEHITSETVRWATLLACCEMLLSGTTTCCDGYFLEDRVASAVYESGLRGVLAQGVIDFPAPAVPDPSKNVETATEYVKSWQGRCPVIKPSIFCHSAYTCSQNTLKKAKAAARESGVLFQIHSAESKQERDDFIKNHGLSPIGYLEKLDILDSETLLVHSVWVDDSDVEVIAKNGAAVSHVPESNMKLGSGIAPVHQMIRAGLRVGLGTDGCASNNTLDLFRTMNVAAKLQKVQSRDPTIMEARTVLKMATIHGADAIGLKDEIGSIEVGKSADIIILNIRKPHLVPLYSPVSHLVYAASGADVSHVFIEGRQVVKDGKLLLLDVEGIMEKVLAFAGEIAHGT